MHPLPKAVGKSSLLIQERALSRYAALHPHNGTRRNRSYRTRKAIPGSPHTGDSVVKSRQDNGKVVGLAV